MVQERLKAAQNRQKSYAYKGRRPLEFFIREVFLRVSPAKDVMHF